MDWYLTGFLIALLLWLWHAVAIIVAVNSTFERNLNKIGQRLSWFTLLPKPMEADDRNRPLWRSVGKYLVVVGFGLPFTLLSWINVAVSIATLVYRRAKDSGAPQAIREFRWRMRNVEMSFDQIVKEMMRASDHPLEDFDKVRADLAEELKSRGLKPGG